MNWIELIFYTELAFHRIRTLVLSYVVLTIISFGVITNLPENGVAWLPYAITAVAYLILTFSWWYNRSVFPKGKKDKYNIVIAIITENEKEKTKLTSDFVDQMSQLLLEYDLSSSYNVVSLHNHHSKLIKDQILDRIDLIKSGSTEESEFEKTTNKLKAKFIVYGKLIKRNAPENKYMFNIHATLHHNPTNPTNGQTLHKEFTEIWKKEVSFLEKEELTGFKDFANHMFVVTSYMIGLSTLVDNEFDKGINIWGRLEKYIAKNLEASEYAEKVSSMKQLCFWLHSQFLYFNGKISESMEFHKKFLELTPDEYGANLAEAILQFDKKQNPTLALEYINRAKKFAGEDGTWRYSEFFLSSELGKYNEALESYNLILATVYNGELSAAMQVIVFNKNHLENNPDSYFSYFIIGAVTYKKLDKPMEAFEILENYINLADKDSEQKEFVKIARKYVSEIEDLIKVK